MRPLIPNKSGRRSRSGGRYLGTHTPTDPPVDSRALIEGQLRHCYGRVVYSHKTQEKCADILLSRLSTIKLWQIILSSITTASFIAAIFGAGPVGVVIGVIVSTTLLVLNAYTKNYDLGQLTQKHRLLALSSTPAPDLGLPYTGRSHGTCSRSRSTTCPYAPNQ